MTFVNADGLTIMGPNGIMMSPDKFKQWKADHTLQKNLSKIFLLQQRLGRNWDLKLQIKRHKVRVQGYLLIEPLIGKFNTFC